MKYIILLIVMFSNVSCNTAIGVWRDTKIGFNWTKEKIQNSQGGGESYDEGAPVY
jgi:predicted small secreted protein